MADFYSPIEAICSVCGNLVWIEDGEKEICDQCMREKREAEWEDEQERRKERDRD